MFDGQTLTLVELYVHGFRDAAYVAFASLAVIIYDYLITFQAELESFWTPPWSLVRALFLLNRYISIVVACVQVYRLVASHPTHIACQATTLIWTYGIVLIFIMGSVILLMRVLAVYRRQKWVTYGLMTLFVLLTVGFLAFTIELNKRTITFDAEPLIHGCPGRMESSSLAVIWRVYVCPIVLQTILVAMILFKAVRQTNQSKAGRGIVGLLARDGVMVYVSVLLALILSIIACFIPILQVPLLASNLLLPVVGISTSRILLNIRSHLSHNLLPHLRHTIAGNTSAGVVSGVEMSALYLGGYHGGIAPARGVEGAKVREIGNTTMIEVPVVDDSTLDDYEDEEHNLTQRYQEDSVGGGSTIEEGPSMRVDGEPSSTLGRAGSATGGYGHPRSRPGSGRAALKISALGATPGWEHWDERLPTKDFRLPTLAVPHTLRPSSPSYVTGSMTGTSGVDSNSNESGSREDLREVQPQVHTVMVTKQIEQITSPGRRRRKQAGSRERAIQWAPPPTASTIRSTTTAHSSGEGDDLSTSYAQSLVQGSGPGRPNGTQAQIQHSRHVRSSSRLRTHDSVSRSQSSKEPSSGSTSAEGEPVWRSASTISPD